MAEEAKTDAEGIKVLILGGCGFIGRNLVSLLNDKKEIAFIRVADKSMPGTSYMSDAHAGPFADKTRVEFKQCDLSRVEHAAKAFADHSFNYVINVAGETRFGQSEADYEKKCLQVATQCAAEAVKSGSVQKWVEVSTAQVYDATKDASTEEAPLKPWTVQAQYRLKAEQAVRAVDTLPVVVLRPCIVYGRGDLQGMTPRITTAATYKQNNKKMKNMWNGDLKLNVVHVDDVVTAIWAAATEIEAGAVFNLADGADLTQGKLNEWLGAMFGIKTGFLGNLASNVLAKVSLKYAADMANDEHVPTWTKMCQEAALNTPLTPYLDMELLYNKHTSIDGTAITKHACGFAYKHAVSADELKDQIVAFQQQKLFPEMELK